MKPQNICPEEPKKMEAQEDAQRHHLYKHLWKLCNHRDAHTGTTEDL